VFDVLRERSIVRNTTSAGSVDCADCSRSCPVEYIADAAGGRRGYIHCPDCGVAEVQPEHLERWEIDTAAFLTAAFGCVNLSLQERAAGQLWRVGKATWAGRSRDVWFARAFRRNGSAKAIDALKGHAKAIVFAPTDNGAERWHAATANLVIGLESTLSLDEGSIVFDTDYVEGRIIDAGMGPDAGPKRRTKRRGGRAAKIELLKTEMISHLHAARDHAFWSSDETGSPTLLPRPTQKELGLRTGLTEADVSRCLNDPHARELRLYWEAAVELGQVMAWSKKPRQNDSTTRV
jgi:hypothetical protein